MCTHNQNKTKINPSRLSNQISLLHSTAPPVCACLYCFSVHSGVLPLRLLKLLCHGCLGLRVLACRCVRKKWPLRDGSSSHSHFTLSFRASDKRDEGGLWRGGDRAHSMWDREPHGWLWQNYQPCDHRTQDCQRNQTAEGESVGALTLTPSAVWLWRMVWPLPVFCALWPWGCTGHREGIKWWYRTWHLKTERL